MRFISENELYKVIGSNIKYYRKLANLTQGELSELAQISISYLSKIEAKSCSKSISIYMLNQLANILNVEITDFFNAR